MGQNTSKNYSNIRSLDSIVSLVIDKKINISSKNKEYTTSNIVEDTVDKNKPIKNIATDIVVEQFFQTEDTLYNFINVVYTNFAEVLKIYGERKNIHENDLFFLYKGGNILRFVSHEFMLEIPASTQKSLQAFYAPYFKRSDADFAIYISPYIKDYHTVHHDIAVISYLVQHRLRLLFLQNPYDYFDFLRFNTQYQEEILNKYLEKFNTIGEFKSVSFMESSTDNYNENSYESKADSATEFLNENPSDKELDKNYRIAKEYNIYDSDSFMTITYNDSLLFYAKGIRTHFTLVRTKIFFNLTKSNDDVMKVGGELIDVGIDYAGDDPENVYLCNNFKKSITEYEIDHKNCKLKFKSFTINYLVHDLEWILFDRVKYPWDDNKYAKRINRLFYFYFIDVFLKIPDGKDRLAIYKDFNSKVLLSLKSGSSITKNINQFKTKYSSINIELLHMLDLLPNLNNKIDDSDNRVEMDKLIELLITNANFAITTLKNLKYYCKYAGKITSKTLTTGDTADLL